MWHSINSTGWCICGARSDCTAGPCEKGRQVVRATIRQTPGKKNTTSETFTVETKTNNKKSIFIFCCGLFETQGSILCHKSCISWAYVLLKCLNLLRSYKFLLNVYINIYICLFYKNTHPYVDSKQEHGQQEEGVRTGAACDLVSPFLLSHTRILESVIDTGSEHVSQGTTTKLSLCQHCW